MAGLATSTPAVGNAPQQIGKYRLVRRPAVGGMAELYLARVQGEQGFEKLVALKKMLPYLSTDREWTQRFVAEARLAARLDHPNIAHVYDFGRDGDALYIAMEYVHGQDLADILNAAYRRKRQLPIDQAVAIVIGLLQGLHYAHDNPGTDGTELIHRDVSPSNVIVGYNGAVKLVDFGIARVASSAAASRVSGFKGKIRYMSPEQCLNQVVDRRCDIFAAGIVLYELITQRRLFGADSDGGVVQQILHDPVTPPSDHRSEISLELDSIVMKALARDRAHRYRTAEEFQVALEELARRERLVTSSVALAELLRTLFPRRANTSRADFADEATAAAPNAPPADDADATVLVGPSTKTPESAERKPRLWLTALVVGGVAALGLVAVIASGAWSSSTAPAPETNGPAAAIGGEESPVKAAVAPAQATSFDAAVAEVAVDPSNESAAGSGDDQVAVDEQAGSPVASDPPVRAATEPKPKNKRQTKTKGESTTRGKTGKAPKPRCALPWQCEDQ